MIKNYELEPTFENVAETLLNDTLKRNNYLYKFYELLNNIDSCFSICLDGAWGCGKTFFVKQAYFLLMSINPCIDIQEENERNILIKIKGEFEKKYQNIPTIHYPIYYDAWDNDNVEDPILSLIYSITKSLHSKNYFTINPNIWEKIKDFVKSISKSVTVQYTKNSILLDKNESFSVCLNGDKFIESLENNKKIDLLGDLKKQDELRIHINNFFDVLLPERGDRLVIFIDELDRCKPTYAIKLLERIKHYFNQEKITFVFSTNIKELNKTVCNYYGQGFSADRYLDRFFNLKLQLPKVDTKTYFDYLEVFNNFGYNEAILREVVLYTNLELREISRFISFYYFARNYYHGYNYPQKPENEAFNFCIDYILPLMIAIKMTDSDLYETFMLGNETEFFENFMRGNVSNIFWRKYSFYPQDGVSLDEIPRAIYNWLFEVGIPDYLRQAIEPTLSFSSNHKSFLEKAISLLSYTSIYE